ncbi:hypothetical protein GCM10025881_23370 [Pseudolysinimonas kribbensis]|uniref:Uncharacterized protein n=1 Tax=Pseudolysinimonas kribbensis TaxID=433641 RepID=A0ABQ6K517_9MICO|nr:hypothetical protein [Pseudolysinimonas kribbensis]GMA95513.1 hypothetical protein GCM10025881_23370 [Pseudolysinimonas kribbensis]
MGSDGEAVRIDLPGARIAAPGAEEPGTVEARLPRMTPGAAAWRLVALDAAVQSSGPVTGLSVAVDPVAAPRRRGP